MTISHSRRSLIGATFAPILLAACAVPTLEESHIGTKNIWRGRLHVQVHSIPPQSLSAAFELRGDSAHGSLLLTSPLGTTLAEAQWTPQETVWRTPSETRRFANTAQMSAQLTGGTPLPLAALFDWLQARPTRADGWEAELQDLTQGRLRAQRTQPEPATQLRIVLEQ